MPSIFLHSSWRVASTYVWSKFRAFREAYCYFEPLNEHLATATPDLVAKFRPWSYANHPELTEPYLQEFLPLLEPGGGMSKFPIDSVFGNYRCGPEGDLPGVAAYFMRLTVFAYRRARIPVFGSVRSELRTGWFHQHLPGVHIFIARDHRRQFISYLRQSAKGNFYFLQRPLVILGANRDDPMLAPVIDAIGLPAHDGPRDTRDTFYEGLARETALPKLYTAFYFLHRLTMIMGPENCDAVIDVDRATMEEDYRRRLGIEIAGLTGFPVTFGDCRVERYDEHLAWSAPFFAGLERTADDLLAGVISPVLPERVLPERAPLLQGPPAY